MGITLVSACSSHSTANGTGTGGQAANGSGTGGAGALAAGSAGKPSSTASPGTGGAAGAAGATSGQGGAMASGGGGTGAAGGSAPVPTTPGQLGGCSLFTADDAWNTDISAQPSDATWTARLQALVGSKNIHPDFGNSGSEHYGMPLNVVPQSQALVPVSFDDYPDESDPGPYPFPDPSTAKIEGGTPAMCSGDCHFLVLQSGACMLYEGYACSYRSGGWHCSNGAKWDLKKNGYGQRPKGWTSADAAGLAITPGVVRYDEVKAGEVKHAIRFTLRCSTGSFVAPATHQAATCGSDANAPPMGLRVRLKADYDISQLSTSAQVVAKAMKRYGLILADNGSDFYFQGEDNPGWTESDVEPLKTIPASAFEAITPGPLEH